jgi:hypothetical protein
LRHPRSSLGQHGGLDVLQHLAQLKFEAPIIVVSGSDDKVREEALMVARRLGLNVCGSFGKPMNLSHCAICSARSASASWSG